MSMFGSTILRSGPTLLFCSDYFRLPIIREEVPQIGGGSIVHQNSHLRLLSCLARPAVLLFASRFRLCEDWRRVGVPVPPEGLDFLRLSRANSSLVDPQFHSFPRSFGVSLMSSISVRLRLAVIVIWLLVPSSQLASFPKPLPNF